MGTINFFWIDVKPSLKQRKILRKFLFELFKMEKRTIQTLNYIICTDQYLLEINKKFLKHDFYTDTITFDLSENKQAIIGEVYLSADRIKENARELGLGFNEELHRVIFHGALHLCGYADKTPTAKTRMRRAENRYLMAYFK